MYIKTLTLLLIFSL